MTNLGLKRIGNKFNIDIFNYQAFSGNYYKCSFSYIYQNDDEDFSREGSINVYRNQTVTQALQEALKK